MCAAYINYISEIPLIIKSSDHSSNIFKKGQCYYSYTVGQ